MGAGASLDRPRSLPATYRARGHRAGGQRVRAPVHGGRFTETIAKVLDRTSTDPGLLTLEVTESVFVRDQQRAVVVLNEIKDIGVKLALDDFGTGYSSLGYLNHPPDRLDQDRPTFTAKVTKDPDSQRIVTSRSSNSPTASG